MPSKLYVTNLSASATLSSVRQFFGACGEVVDVEFVAERNPGRLPSAAYVTMATHAGAQAAVEKLHGRLLHDRSAQVSLTQGSEYGSREERKAKKAGPPVVSVAQQYRDRHGMTYELDCLGLPLKLRFFFPEQGGAERVEARANQGVEIVLEASAKTRALALDAVAEAWRALPAQPAVPALDWVQVATALKTVRAI